MQHRRDASQPKRDCHLSVPMETRHVDAIYTLARKEGCSMAEWARRAISKALAESSPAVEA